MSNIAAQSSSNSYKQTIAGSGIVASDGTITITFNQPPSGSYATGSVTIYDAPQSASWIIQVNGVNIDKALGAATTGGIQIGPQDELTFVGSGMIGIVGTTLHGSFNAVISPENATQLLTPGHDPLVITQDALIVGQQVVNDGNQSVLSNTLTFLTFNSFNVGDTAYVILTEEWQNLATNTLSNVFFTTQPPPYVGVPPPIGPTFTWTRTVLDTTVPRQTILPVLGPYMFWQVQSGSSNTLSYNITTVAEAIPLDILNPPIQVIQSGVAGITAAANSEIELLPSSYPGPGLYKAKFAFGATGATFPALPITDQGTTATIPASVGNTTILAAPAAGFQNRIKHYEFHANTTAFGSTTTYTLSINGANIDVQYYGASGLASQGELDIVTTSGVILLNSGTTGGQAALVYSVEPIPLVVRLATVIPGVGNPQLAGQWIIDAYHSEFDFIAPMDDWFLYVNNQSASSITYSCEVVGPYN